MFDAIVICLAAFLGALYLLGPLAVRWTFRFAARCRPSEIPLNQLPYQVAELFDKRIPEIRELGLDLVGCYDCGGLATETHSYVAYFCNRRTNDFANVSAAVTPKHTASYLEFSTHSKTAWSSKPIPIAFCP